MYEDLEIRDRLEDILESIELIQKSYQASSEIRT